MLLEAQHSGVPISDELIRDEATTFLLGGNETTAIALAWVWHLLVQHPEVEQRLAEHLAAELQGRPVGFADLPRLTYLDQVVKESMRLYPPAWYATRRTDRDVELGGYRVPEGVTVVMNIWAVHHDPRFYPDPEVFRPERWTEEFTKSLQQVCLPAVRHRRPQEYSVIVCRDGSHAGGCFDRPALPCERRAERGGHSACSHHAAAR